MNAAVLREEQMITAYGRDRKVRMIRERRHARRVSRVKAGIAFGIFLLITTASLYYYLQLTNTLKDQAESLAVMESRLVDLKEDNDDEMRRISGSEDIESIRRIAVQELGMHYAKEGQIIPIDAEEGDYLVQFGSIPINP